MIVEAQGAFSSTPHIGKSLLAADTLRTKKRDVIFIELNNKQ